MRFFTCVYIFLVELSMVLKSFEWFGCCVLVYFFLNLLREGSQWTKIFLERFQTSNQRFSFVLEVFVNWYSQPYFFRI